MAIGRLSELNALWTEQCARAATWPAIPQTLEQADYIREWAPRPALSGRARRAAALAPAAMQPPRSRSRRSSSATANWRRCAPARAVSGRAAGARGRRCAGGGDAVSALRAPSRPWATCSAADRSICRAAPGATTPRWRCAWRRAWWRAELRRPRPAGTLHALAARRLSLGHRAMPGDHRGHGAGAGGGRSGANPPAAGSGDPAPLEAEALSRVAPIVLHYFAEPEQAVAAAADAARVTSQSPLVLDACRLLAAMLHAALSGAPRERVLAPDAAVFGAHPLRAPVAALAARAVDAIRSWHRGRRRGAGAAGTRARVLWLPPRISATARCARSTSAATAT